MSEQVTLSEAAIAALTRGHKVEAIKITRVEKSLGLKEAKDQVDTYLLQHPEIKAQMPQLSQETGLRIIIIVAGAVLLFLFFFKR